MLTYLGTLPADLSMYAYRVVVACARIKRRCAGSTPYPQIGPPCGAVTSGTEQTESPCDMFRPFLPATQRPPSPVAPSAVHTCLDVQVWFLLWVRLADVVPAKIRQRGTGASQTELVLDESTPHPTRMSQFELWTTCVPKEVPPRYICRHLHSIAKYQKAVGSMDDLGYQIGDLSEFE
jgi:hypothetical protein